MIIKRRKARKLQHDLAQDGPDNAIKGARGHLSLLASNKLDHGVMVDRNGAAPSSVFDAH